MDSQSPEAMYRNLPVVTRTIGTAMFFITLAASLKIIDPSMLIFFWPLIKERLHVWRLFTDYLYAGQFSLNWLFHMYFFITFSSRLEQHRVFSSQQGSFLYFLFIQMILLDTFSLILFYPSGLPILAPALQFSIVYYWSKKEPFAPVSIWGFSLVAWKFPYALIFLDLVMGQRLLYGLMGIVSGHIYYFIKDILPYEKNLNLLPNTPRIFQILTNKMDFFRQPPTTGSVRRNTNFRTFSDQPNINESHGRDFRPPNNTNEFPGQGYRLS